LLLLLLFVIVCVMWQTFFPPLFPPLLVHVIPSTRDLLTPLFLLLSPSLTLPQKLQTCLASINPSPKKETEEMQKQTQNPNGKYEKGEKIAFNRR